MLALAGYIVGYVITPIARQLLLLFIATYLFGLFLPWCTYKFSKKNAVTEENWEFKKKQHGAFVSRLKEKKQSLKFTRIRELAPRNAQYIEFWDMHSKMSHNLAFACIIFMGVLLSNWSLFGDLQMVIFLIAFISFLVLLYLSFDYSLWWSKDLGESFKLTHYKDFIRHFRE